MLQATNIDGQIFICLTSSSFSFLWGVYLVELKDHSWLCTQRPLLLVPRESSAVPGLEPKSATYKVNCLNPCIVSLIP